MDPELKEKLRVRRLLSEDCVHLQEDFNDNQHEVKHSNNEESIEHVAAVGCSSSTNERKVKAGQVASLRRAHEVMAARIASPRRSMQKPSKKCLITEHLTTTSEIKYSVDNDEADGCFSDVAAAEPIEYLMLELMPLLPAETAEHLFRAVRAGEQRTLRLERSAEVLRGKIEDGQAKETKANAAVEGNGSKKTMSEKTSHSQLAPTLDSRKKLKWDYKCHFLRFFSFAWFCVGILLGVFCIIAYWIMVNSHGTVVPVTERKNSTKTEKEQLALDVSISAPHARLWMLRRRIQHMRAHRHRCQFRQRHLVEWLNRTRMGVCARNAEAAAKEQSVALSSKNATPLQTFALEQRSILQRLEAEIKELRRSVAACQRCASAFGMGSSC